MVDTKYVGACPILYCKHYSALQYEPSILLSSGLVKKIELHPADSLILVPGQGTFPVLTGKFYFTNDLPQPNAIW